MSVARLRIEQQELKCINGCGYYGNAKFDYLCSICFRERNERRRRENGQLSTRTAVTVDIATHSERGSSSVSHAHHESNPAVLQKSPETSTGATKKKIFMVPVPAVIQNTLLQTGRKNRIRIDKSETVKVKSQVPDLIDVQLTTQLRKLRISEDAKRLLRSEIELLDSQIQHYLHGNSQKNIEEWAGTVRQSYSDFASLVQTDPRFLTATEADRESAIDFFEKVITTKNHKFLFSPYFTNDEECDMKIQRRIRQLSWITAKHLLCRIDEVNTASRDLVYSAITDLVAMDSFYSPQEKLECIVRCSKCIMELLRHSVGGPASGDDFQPAIIFIVLKANPVRLHSNINFVRRFASDKRQGRGEGAYYFTLLCCAIIFIENLNATSLEMSKEKFDELMNSEKPENSAWETALLACESVHQIRENMQAMGKIRSRCEDVDKNINKFRNDIEEFKRTFVEKVDAAIAKAPLKVGPIRTPHHLRHLARKGTPYDIDDDDDDENVPSLLELDVGTETTTVAKVQRPSTFRPLSPMRVAAEAAEKSARHSAHTPEPKASILPSIDSFDRLSPMPELDQSSLVSPLLIDSSFHDTSLSNGTTANSMEDLFFNIAQMNRGLKKINYDIDYSDHSGTSSTVEELKPNLAEFDPLTTSGETLDNSNEENGASAAIGTVATTKLLDLFESDSPTIGMSLPSPLQPVVADYRGFSACDIPSISCNTGDFSLSPDQQEQQQQYEQCYPHRSAPLPPKVAMDSPRSLVGDRC